MYKKLSILMLGIAFTATMALADTWTGYVSDAKCGARHSKGTQADINCVKACIGGGSDAVLVVDDKVVTIANKDKVADLLGQKVTITGKLEDGKIVIESAKAAE